MSAGDLFVPYNGNEPYIYVSYCRKDTEAVNQFLSVLHSRGYRIWADIGNADGADYVGTIADRIKNCEIFFCFLTRCYVEADFCLMEMNFAVSARKMILPIMLEKVDFPQSVDFFLSRFQRFRVDGSLEEEAERLCSMCEGLLSPCYGGASSGSGKNGSLPKREFDGLTFDAPDDRGNFIFISYAHKDNRQVIPIIHRLQEEGYIVWYDEGIDPGTEWDEYIAGKVNDSGFFVAMISEAYLASSNCRDELAFARELDKKRVLVYLEKVDLPLGMKMRLGRLQAIHRYAYPQEEDFYKKLFSTQGLSACRR